MPGFHAIIVAAGTGSRAGAGLPKQYRPLAGIPVLRRTVDQFMALAGLKSVIVVIGPGQESLCAEVLGEDAPVTVVIGGASRRESARAGLDALTGRAAPDDIVLIHDAARPFVSNALVERVVVKAREKGAAIPAIPVIDTLKRVEKDGAVAETVDRAPLRAAQTPQGFVMSALARAHGDVAASHPATDDASLFEALGLPVAVVDGDPTNLKLTTEADFQMAETRMADTRRVRTGFGYDVHRLGPGTHLWLMGIELSHDRSLIGHSDADVGLHAITDAILGALSAGDIGSHFPPSDPAWRGADSSRFLAHAMALAADRGALLEHVDATLICEAPRIGPHREAMRARVSEILGIETDMVSIKATTTEKLGFTGRGEGIACQAIATLSVPGSRA